MQDADRIIALVKQGNLIDARLIAGLDDSNAPNENFVAAVMSLDQARDVLKKGRHAQAAPHLLSTLTVFGKTSNKALLFKLNILCKFCVGMSNLFAGDTYGAKRLFDEAASDLNGASFIDNNYKVAAYSIKAAAYIALYKIFLSIGEIDKAEDASAEAEAVYRDLLKLDITRKAAKNNAILEANSVAPELAINGALQRLSCLDVEPAMAKLEGAREAYNELRKIINDVGDTTISFVLKANLSLYDAFVGLCQVSKVILKGKNIISRKEYLLIERVVVQLSDARNFATKARERGRIYLFTINQLERYASNLTEIGRMTKNDFGRYSGAVSLISFFLCCVLLRFVADPAWLNSKVHFIGVIIISLVVGFGYGAIRFKSLISLVADKKESGE